MRVQAPETKQWNRRRKSLVDEGEKAVVVIRERLIIGLQYHKLFFP